MRDPRVESPPPGAVLSTEQILRNPPNAPLRRRLSDPDQYVSIYPIAPGGSLSPPRWNIFFLDDDQSEESNNGDGSNGRVAPSWKLLPRRRLFIESQDHQYAQPESNRTALELPARHIPPIVSDDSCNELDNHGVCRGRKVVEEQHTVPSSRKR